MDVKVGDIVLFGKWSGTEVKLTGKSIALWKSQTMGISKGKNNQNKGDKNGKNN